VLSILYGALKGDLILAYAGMQSRDAHDFWPSLGRSRDFRIFAYQYATARLRV
jgi:hypothetical protein